MSEKMINLVISIVIYNPNIKDLKSLFHSYSRARDYASRKQKLNDTIIIVDNNPDGAYQHLVIDLLRLNGINYQYINSTVNGGYGHGHNQAIDKLNSDYHLICNPDIEFFDETLEVGIRTMQERSDVVLLSPSVHGKDGARQYLCKRNPQLFHLFLRRFAPKFIKNNLFKKYLDKYEYRDLSYEDEIENVPFCTGCFMFLILQVSGN